ncbi:MAG: hypothetical protein J6Q30_00395 [Oscillospiraceae bacterium]|nr:hypothetical protein [Oscillospiraceae bacterium]
MMDYSAIIRNTFDFGSIRDAQILFEQSVRNAFPAYDFRRLELIRFVRDDKFMEGRSWNHVFQIRYTTYKDAQVWEIKCQRVTMGISQDKTVYLDYLTLTFLENT